MTPSWKARQTFIGKGREEVSRCWEFKGDLPTQGQTSFLLMSQIWTKFVLLPTLPLQACGFWLIEETYRGVSTHPFSGMCSPTESTTAIIKKKKKKNLLGRNHANFPLSFFEYSHTTLPHGWLKGAVNSKRLNSLKKTLGNRCECTLQGFPCEEGAQCQTLPPTATLQSRLGTLLPALKLALGRTSKNESLIAYVCQQSKP